MKYQVVFLASPWKVDELKASMEDFPDIVFVTLDEMDSEIPTLYLYYGCSPKDASVSNDMEAMLRVGVDRKNVQPIAKNPDDFKTDLKEKELDLEALLAETASELAQAVAEETGRYYVEQRRTDQIYGRQAYKNGKAGDSVNSFSQNQNLAV